MVCNIGKFLLLFGLAVILTVGPAFAAVSEKETTVASEKETTSTSEKETTAAQTDVKQQAPVIEVSSTDKGLVITWPYVQEAEFYRIYRAEDKGRLETVALIPAKQEEKKSETETVYPLPAVEAPAKTLSDHSGKITGYSYTDSLILPGKQYHYYVQVCHEKTRTLSTIDKNGAEGVWDVTALQIRAGTQLTEDAVRQLGEDSFFQVSEISDELFHDRMYGKSYKDYCDVPRENLRYIRCLHRDIHGAIKVGELVMSTSCADSVCEIFHELYRQAYPIESMLLVDDFDADDETSILHNNTSAFNYRMVDNTTELSNHALGLAIDINPYYNVYYIPSENYIFPPEGWAYLDREADFPYKLTEGDLCYNLFIEAGFSWGGYFTYNIDYQHFYYTGN